MNGILPLTLCTQTAAIAVYYIADEGIVFHAQMISALNLRATYQVFFLKEATEARVTAIAHVLFLP